MAETAAPVQTGELIDKQEASPKKRRKKASAAGEVEEGAPAAKRLKHDDVPAAGAPVCMQPACKPTICSSNRKHVPHISPKGDQKHQLVGPTSGCLSPIVCLVQTTTAVPETRDGFEQNAASASLAHLTGAASVEATR